MILREVHGLGEPDVGANGGAEEVQGPEGCWLSMISSFIELVGQN